jgi:hypothetical protein
MRRSHDIQFPDFGAVAQLGERLHGMQEVRGSIPLGSTNKIKHLAQKIPNPDETKSSPSPQKAAL